MNRLPCFAAALFAALSADPKRRLVIASNANWAAGASDPATSAAREAFYRAVQKAIDAEAGASGAGAGQ